MMLGEKLPRPSAKLEPDRKIAAKSHPVAPARDTAVRRIVADIEEGAQMRRRHRGDIGVAAVASRGVERFDLECIRRKLARRRRGAIAEIGEHHRDFVVTVEDSGTVAGQRLGSIGQRVAAIGQHFIHLKRNRRQMSVMRREYLEMVLGAAEKPRYRGALQHDGAPRRRPGTGGSKRGGMGRGSDSERQRDWNCAA